MLRDFVRRTGSDGEFVNKKTFDVAFLRIESSFAFFYRSLNALTKSLKQLQNDKH